MAKVRKQFSISDAISAVTAAIRVEANGELSQEQKSQAINSAMDVLDNSGFQTLAENADDNIETMHQVEEILEAGGLDMVEMQRQSALQGARAMVEAEQARIGAGE